MLEKLELNHAQRDNFSERLFSPDFQLALLDCE